MLALKVTTIGHSTGIILPKEALGKLKIKKGDILYLTESTDGYRLTTYDEKFLKQMKVGEEIAREDKDVLHALARS